LTLSQIRNLAARGFTIGAHSQSHRRLSECEPDEAETEIAGSCERIRDITGQESVPFAFPYSSRGLTLSFLEAVRRANPVVGCFFDTRGLRPAAPWHVNRIWAEASDRAGAQMSLSAILRLEMARLR